MNQLRDILGTVLDVAAHHHAPSWDDMDADEFLLICIGMVIFVVAFVIYAHWF